MEEDKVTAFTRIKSFSIQSKRVWLVLRKPSMDEFMAIAKVSAIGLLVIGALGFLISDLLTFIMP